MKPIEWSRIFSIRNIVVLLIAVSAIAFKIYKGYADVSVSDIYGLDTNRHLSLTWTPVILGTCALLIAFITKGLKPIEKMLATFLIVVASDFSMIYFAYGTYDREGAAWVLWYLLIGIVAPVLFVGIGVTLDKSATQRQKSTAILLFPVLIFLYVAITRVLNVGLTTG